MHGNSTIGAELRRYISIRATFKQVNNSTVVDNTGDGRSRSDRLFDRWIYVLGSLSQYDWVGEVSSSV